MRALFYFGLIFSVACSQDEIILEDDFDNPCTSQINITDLSTDFAAEFDGDLWIPNQGSFSSYHDGKLNINARDSPVNAGIWNSLNIQIESPFLGYNDISISNDSYMIFDHVENMHGYIVYVDCGFVKLEKLDTLNGYISGYFHGTINSPQLDLEIDISNGVFNNLEITPLFCETSYSIESVVVDLFQNWNLIGIFSIEGNIISHLPCNSLTSMTFSAESNVDFTEYIISGNGVINSYMIDLELVDNSTLITSGVLSTNKGGAEHQMDFEDYYFGLIANSTLSYSIEDNILSIINKKESVLLKFVLQE